MRILLVGAGLIGLALATLVVLAIFGSIIGIILYLMWVVLGFMVGL